MVFDEPDGRRIDPEMVHDIGNPLALALLEDQLLVVLRLRLGGLLLGEPDVVPLRDVAQITFGVHEERAVDDLGELRSLDPAEAQHVLDRAPWVADLVLAPREALFVDRCDDDAVRDQCRAAIVAVMDAEDVRRRCRHAALHAAKCGRQVSTRSSRT